MDSSIGAIFNVISIALEIWAFIYAIRTASIDQKIKTILKVVFIALLIFSLLAVGEYIRHKSYVHYAEKVINDDLKNGSKTIDQLVESFFPPDYSIVSEALDDLIKDDVVRHEIIEVSDSQDRLFRVRRFYLKP